MTNSEFTVSRRQMIQQYYRLPQDKQIEADNLFMRMDSLAATCTDAGDFEQKLVSSGLSNEFTQMLQRFGKYAAVNGNTVQSQMVQGGVQTVAGGIMDGIARQTAGPYIHESGGSIKHQIKNRLGEEFLPEPIDHVRRFGLRGLPVVGGLFGFFEFIAGFFRIRKNKKELEQQQQQMFDMSNQQQFSQQAPPQPYNNAQQSYENQSQQYGVSQQYYGNTPQQNAANTPPTPPQIQQ